MIHTILSPVSGFSYIRNLLFMYMSLANKYYEEQKEAALAKSKVRLSKYSWSSVMNIVLAGFPRESHPSLLCPLWSGIESQRRWMVGRWPHHLRRPHALPCRWWGMSFIIWLCLLLIWCSLNLRSRVALIRSCQSTRKSPPCMRRWRHVLALQLTYQATVDSRIQREFIGSTRNLTCRNKNW